MINRIIIEGADQQGKTTLCKLLSERLGWKVVHYGKPEAEFDFIRGYNLPEKTISDRNFLSEIVYSKVNGRTTRAAATMLCARFKSHDTMLILMDREEHFIFDSERHEDYKKDEILKAISLYRTEFSKMNMEKMKLNPNSPEYNARVESLIEYLNDSI